MIITKKDVEKAESERKTLIAASNRAETLIRDALARYIKEKTRAKSRAAALERDAALHSPHFNAIAEYERREDIQDAYGCDCITAGERDRLEELWDEREAILKHTDDNGDYTDEVTAILKDAAMFAYSYYEKRIDDAEQTLYAFKIEQERENRDAGR